jgi:hypothetical protein
MTIRTGHQYRLPYRSSLAVLGKCPIPPDSSGFGPEEGLLFMVETDAGMSAIPEGRAAAYLQLVMRSILALLRHHSAWEFGHFDPTVLTMEPTSNGHTWKRLIFRTAPLPIHRDLEGHCRKLAKRLSFAWSIADWLMKVEGTNGHCRVENCPIRPIDAVCQILGGSVYKLAPEAFQWHVRRWCEHPIDTRDDWYFYRQPHMGRCRDDEAQQWLIGNQFLVQDEKNERRYWFTEKFVRLCWQDAMSNLA